MLILVLSIIAALASLAGVYAIVDNRRNRRIKLLAYEEAGPIPLATTEHHEQSYKLEIVYRPAENEPEERIEAAFVTYLRFANFGREPIRATDIAHANPLRIEVEGIRALDISLAGTCRDVSQISVGKPDLGDTHARADVTFDFLDFEDGGIVRVLTAGWRPDAKIRLVGDIIGMRAGIARTDERPRRGKLWGKIGLAAFAISEVVAFAAVVVVFHQVDGSWADTWLIVLPFAALVIPIFAAIVISDTIWPGASSRRQYPKELALPRWLAGFPPHLMHAEPWPMFYTPEIEEPTSTSDHREPASAIASRSTSSHD